MKEEICNCDRCKKNIDNSEPLFTFEASHTEEDSKYPDLPVEFDFCESCLKKFLKFMKGDEKSEEAKPAKAKKSKE